MKLLFVLTIFAHLAAFALAAPIPNQFRTLTRSLGGEGYILGGIASPADIFTQLYRLRDELKESPKGRTRLLPRGLLRLKAATRLVTAAQIFGEGANFQAAYKALGSAPEHVRRVLNLNPVQLRTAAETLFEVEHPSMLDLATIVSHPSFSSQSLEDIRAGIRAAATKARENKNQIGSIWILMNYVKSE